MRYIATFLPHLADPASMLTPLTSKEFNKEFPEWTSEHQQAFDRIKQLATSTAALAPMHTSEGDKIFVTTDASEVGTGAVLSVGKDWKTARPIAYDSTQLNSAERNYPVHEKELLAIVRALKKWCYYLLGAPFMVYTDHRTLEYFQTQKDFSRCQVRWSELFLQYDFEIVYLKGSDDEVADVLSHVECAAADIAPTCAVIALAEAALVAPVTTIAMGDEMLHRIKAVYETDEWCVKLRGNLASMDGIGAREEDGLLYVGLRLVVPNTKDVRETLYRLAHDALGHFGLDKAYGTLCDSYYWPNMRRQLEGAYVPGCDVCQQNKSATAKPAGPLHPLPVSDQRFDSVAIDFVGPLPEEEGFNGIMTMTNRLGAADMQIVPVRMDMDAKRYTAVFFEKWFCENRLPLEIVSDRDKLFTSKFWKELHRIASMKLKMSTAFHPETDGASERTNKTMVQTLRYLVNCEQQGWVKVLPYVRFVMMNTVNALTGISPFYLKTGRSPRLIPPLGVRPPLAANEDPETSVACAFEFLDSLTHTIAEARDGLIATKTRQAHHANQHRHCDDLFKVGDRVMLKTDNQRARYRAQDPSRTAKLFPCYRGPYAIIHAFPERSEYTLAMPDSPQTFPGFHASKLAQYRENDDEEFPGRHMDRPGPVDADADVFEVEHIVDARCHRVSWRYLVEFVGYGQEDQHWITRTALRRTVPNVVADWERTHPQLA